MSVTGTPSVDLGEYVYGLGSMDVFSSKLLTIAFEKAYAGFEFFFIFARVSYSAGPYDVGFSLIILLGTQRAEAGLRLRTEFDLDMSYALGAGPFFPFFNRLYLTLEPSEY